MIDRLFHRKATLRRPIPRGVSRDLPPHQLRDIGVCPASERPRPPLHPLW